MKKVLARGNVLRVELEHFNIFKFDHYGIYAGEKEVIHFSEGKIRRESIERFIEYDGSCNFLLHSPLSTGFHLYPKNNITFDVMDLP